MVCGPVRRSLIPHLVPLSSFSPFPGDVTQLQLPAEMQELVLNGCKGITGTSGLSRTSRPKRDLRFGLRTSRTPPLPHLVPRSSLPPFPGNVAQLQLPATMENLDLSHCPGITGTSALPTTSRPKRGLRFGLRFSRTVPPSLLPYFLPPLLRFSCTQLALDAQCTINMGTTTQANLE